MNVIYELTRAEWVDMAKNGLVIPLASGQELRLVVENRRRAIAVSKLESKPTKMFKCKHSGCTYEHYLERAVKMHAFRTHQQASVKKRKLQLLKRKEVA